MNYFYVYILHCHDGSYYIGHTENLELRISEHNQGKFSGYTSKRLPVKLVYHQQFNLRDDAFTAERKLKKWSRKKKEALINENWSLVSYFAKKKFKKN